MAPADNSVQRLVEKLEGRSLDDIIEEEWVHRQKQKKKQQNPQPTRPPQNKQQRPLGQVAQKSSRRRPLQKAPEQLKTKLNPKRVASQRQRQHQPQAHDQNNQPQRFGANGQGQSRVGTLHRREWQTNRSREDQEFGSIGSATTKKIGLGGFLRRTMNQKREQLARTGSYSLYPPLSTRQGPQLSQQRRKRPLPGSGVLTGQVLKFDARLGWGFLHSDDVDGQVFVHVSECDLSIGQLFPGDIVGFELDQQSHATGKAPRALAVRLIGARGPRATNRAVRQAVPARPQMAGASKLQSQHQRTRSSYRSVVAGSAAEAGTVHFHMPDHDPDVVDTEWGSSANTSKRQRRSSAAIAAPPPLSGIRSPRSDCEAPPTGRNFLDRIDDPSPSGNGCAVRVRNIPWTVSRQRLLEAFEAVGEVIDLELDENRVGEAIVAFRSTSAARRAVQEYHGGSINGREISVDYEV